MWLLAYLWWRICCRNHVSSDNIRTLGWGTSKLIAGSIIIETVVAGGSYDATNSIVRVVTKLFIMVVLINNTSSVQVHDKTKSMVLAIIRMVDVMILNLLFPHIWQQDPKKTNPHYHQIMERNKIREIEVLRCVVRFVKNSKRFNKEKYCL